MQAALHSSPANRIHRRLQTSILGGDDEARHLPCTSSQAFEPALVVAFGTEVALLKGLLEKDWTWVGKLGSMRAVQAS